MCAVSVVTRCNRMDTENELTMDENDTRADGDVRTLTLLENVGYKTDRHQPLQT